MTVLKKFWVEQKNSWKHIEFSSCIFQEPTISPNFLTGRNTKYRIFPGGILSTVSVFKRFSGAFFRIPFDVSHPDYQFPINSGKIIRIFLRKKNLSNWSNSQTIILSHQQNSGEFEIEPKIFSIFFDVGLRILKETWSLETLWIHRNYGRK